jgi:hypothetical protein
MRNKAAHGILITAAMAVFLVLPGISEAQGEGTVSATVISEGTFITVKESIAGEVLSLYRVKGDRIVLVDTVVNTNSRSDRDIKLPDRFLHHLDVENR